ncbi:uncharacterized protein BT62DRAFT_981044 [Guyanagaster necrorhizus]|uniref:DUF6534 domain-containing protein n=1 Tax=Guyanagaster necrorhizus TaxID=856835 RepID=A0A9P7VRX9_9AGAR|nr:uncharacterized protein BT62DRAFT_981044 [Guyanagaster necrorhizus MCA 3950]KAG7445553.1 hypothetical protein BT62DRAFT_981044 [Guyanagaster necrorhizus MCA 3950]
MTGAAEVAHGPILIGLMFNTLLLGVVIAQVYIYMTTYQKDRLWMKAYVIFLFLTNLLNSAFIMAYTYISLIKHFDDVPYLYNATWLFSTDPALTGIIAGAVQLFFAWRVKVLTSNWYLGALVAILALTGVGSSIVVAIKSEAVGAFTRFQEFKSIVVVWLVSACVGDFTITAILVWYLRKHKTGFQGSDELVDRIIRATVQTGLITSIMAIIDLIVYLVDSSGLHLLFNLTLARLYTNTLMSSLNSRSGWSYSNSNPDSHSQSGLVSTSGVIGSGSRGRKGTGTVTRPEVFVHVEQHELGDIRSPGVVSPRFVIEDMNKGQDGGDESSLKRMEDDSVWEDGAKRNGTIV